MGKSHRHRHKARVKAETRGVPAFATKQRRRQSPYVGPWEITYACRRTLLLPMARSGPEVHAQATAQHACHDPQCKPTSFKRLAG